MSESVLVWARRRLAEDMDALHNQGRRLAVSPDIMDAYLDMWDRQPPWRRFVLPSGEYAFKGHPLVLREDWSGPRMEWAE